MPMDTITAYSDYRSFLKDYFAEQKRLNPRYSYRLFALKAGVASTGLFHEVAAGKRNLTPSVLLRFAKAMKLDTQDQAYFECLVAFNQAKTVEEKNHHYARMMAFRGTRVDIVGAGRYEFYRHWWNTAVRELINCRPMKAVSREDFAAIGQSLQPPISAAQARRAVDLLLRLGFVRKGADGTLRQTERFISTGSLDPSAPTTLDVDNFQIAMLELARKAMDGRPRSQRDFSTLTLSLSAAGEAAAKAEIAALRKRLLALAERDRDADRVLQLNFQAFPLSKTGTQP